MQLIDNTLGARDMKNYDKHLSGGENSSESRAQPRKSDFYRHKKVSHHADVYEDEGRHTHRSQPSKNIIRVELRRIQQLFTHKEP
jgi:hypothetical protein